MVYLLLQQAHFSLKEISILCNVDLLKTSGIDMRSEIL